VVLQFEGNEVKRQRSKVMIMITADPIGSDIHLMAAHQALFSFTYFYIHYVICSVEFCFKITTFRQQTTHEYQQLSEG